MEPDVLPVGQPVVSCKHSISGCATPSPPLNLACGPKLESVMQRCFTSCANFLLNSLSFAGRSQFLKTLTLKRSLAPSEIWDGSQKDFRTLLSRPFSYVDIRYVLRIFTSLASSRPRSRVARSLESSFSSHLPKVLAFVSSLLSKYWSQSQDHLDLAVSWSKIQDQDLIPWQSASDCYISP